MHTPLHALASALRIAVVVAGLAAVFAILAYSALVFVIVAVQAAGALGQ